MVTHSMRERRSHNSNALSLLFFNGGRILALTDVIAQIDAEILKLQQAKELLGSGSATTAPRTGRGRPKGSKNAVKAIEPKTAAATSGKRQLSPEGRKAIAEAMKRRWAERRKQTAK